MTYLGFVASTPYSWTVLCGVLTGIAVGGITRVIRPRPKAEDARDRSRVRAARASQLTRVLFYLTGAVACVPAAVFIPDAEAILDPLLPRFFLGAAAGGFVCERFPRAIGLPSLFLGTLTVVLGFGVLRAYEPVYGQATIAEIRVLSAQEGTIRLELFAEDELRNGPTLGLGVVELEGSAVAPVVSRLRLHPGWFVFGRRLGYRIEGINSYESEAAEVRQPVDRARVAPPEGRDAFTLRILDAIEPRLPGVERSEVSAPPREVRSLARYTVLLDETVGEPILTAVE